MASTQTNIDLTSTPPAVATGGLLVSLAPLAQEAFETTLGNLALAFPGETVLVATPDAAPQSSSGSPLRLISYTPTAVSATPWFLTAADYVNAYKLAQENQATACVLLGAEAGPRFNATSPWRTTTSAPAKASSTPQSCTQSLAPSSARARATRPPST
jgi:hypothetical protein